MDGENILGIRIKQMLALRGLSSKQLARKIGISESALSNIVCGVTSPRTETVEAIAQGLGVGVWTLFVPLDRDVPHCPGCGMPLHAKVTFE